MSKITEQEKQEFDKLYKYVKTEILNYNENMALPKFMILKLKGLKDGKFIANNHIKSMGNYSYETIRLTFVFCKPIILKSIKTKKFKNETQKFNYICAIVNNNLNDVLIRQQKALKSKRESQKQIDKIQIDNIDIENNFINTKKENQNDNKNNKFTKLTKEMW